MTGVRDIAIMAVAGAAISIAAVPAMGAGSELLRAREIAPVSLDQLGSIASFTPSIRDEKLQSAYAKAVLGRNNNARFQFTPTSGSLSGRRSITVLVRADKRGADADERTGSPLGIAPLAFNLDASRGWRKFALPDSVGRKPLDPVLSDLAGVSNFSLEKQEPKKSRLKADVHLDAKRDVGTAPQTLAGERQYSVDAATSYSLTRNLNVTAGVRYATPDNRLSPITDQRQDDQAVYVGTIFKF